MICTGCVSLTIPAPVPQDNQFGDLSVCSDVVEEEGLFMPFNEAAEFSTGDSPLYTLVKLLRVNREIRLRWKWYSPKGSLFRDTGDVLVNIEGKFMSALTAYDEMELPSGMQGRWTVVIFLDDNLLGRRSFTINPPESFSSPFAHSRIRP